jgi:hypothetical protein
LQNLPANIALCAAAPIQVLMKSDNTAGKVERTFLDILPWLAVLCLRHVLVVGS